MPNCGRDRILKKGCIPSFEEARRADLINVTLPRAIGAAGEVKQLFQFTQALDLPRRAEF